jgi:hypothetical protein
VQFCFASCPFFVEDHAMALYEIIETDAGLTVVEMEPGAPPEETALRHDGIVVDAGPFPSFDDAYDAVLALQKEEDEEAL